MEIRPFNWGIIGCGNIANQFCIDLQFAENAKVYAVASRSKQRAEKFKEKFNTEKVYLTYEELAEDPQIDAIYIATPHSFHYEHTLLCLKNKKPVLCEKPFALDALQTAEMIETARKNNTFLMDAFWVRFLPIYIEVKEIVESKQMGELKMMRADFGFNAPFAPEGRLYNKKLGGGALLDIGVYPIFSTLLFMGFPDDVATFASIGKTGVDEQIAMLFKYNDGRIANLHASIEVESPVDVDLYFEKGWVRIQRNGVFFRDLVTCHAGKKPETKTFSIPGYGQQFEASEVMQCVRKGLIESAMMPHEFTLKFLQLVDKIKEQAGIDYSKGCEINSSIKFLSEEFINQKVDKMLCFFRK